MKLKLRSLLIVTGFLLIFLSFIVQTKEKTNSNGRYLSGSFNRFNILNGHRTELYNDILGMINIKKKKGNVDIDMNFQLDSSLICFDKIKRYVEGNVIKIFYHDSDNVYFSFEKMYKYLEQNHYKPINSCMADGPDGTDQVYLKKRLLLLVTGQWDGGDDSDTTYIPSKYFEISFYIINMNKTDSVVISNIDR